MDSRLLVNPIKKKGKGQSHKKGQGMMSTSGQSDTSGNLLTTNCNSNTREREKTQSVNTAYTTLRTLIPTEPQDRKLSKIETLRLASSYISHLSSHLLAENFHGENDGQFPQSSPSQSRICTFCLSESKKLRSSNILPQPPNVPVSTVTTIQSSYCQLPPSNTLNDDFYEDYHSAIMFNPPHHQLNHSNNLQIYY